MKNFKPDNKNYLIFVFLFLSLSLLFGCNSLSKTPTAKAVNDSKNNENTKPESGIPGKPGVPKEEKRAELPKETNSNTDSKSNENPVNASEPLPISWSFTPSQYRGKNGQKFTFNCSPNGNAGTVFGTDTYTDDSSVCTAAVHAGVITLSTGGVVTIEIRPGKDAYVGSERNGFKSSDFNNSWSGSFIFPKNTGGGS